MSGQIVHLEPDPHVAVQRLLPWYLTGRLETTEHDAVETHLAVCPECRTELETERQWQLLQPGHHPTGNVEDGWARLRARLDGETYAAAAHVARGARGALPQPGSTAAAAAAAGLASASASTPRRRGGVRQAWQVGLRVPPRAWAAPALLSVALAVALGVTLRPASVVGDFHALAAPAETGATAVVRFRPDATEAQIRHGLKEAGARLVDGPTVSDAYVVRLPREHYAEALDKLRKEPGVALVEALESASP
jgi:hypothetical protein